MQDLNTTQLIRDLKLIEGTFSPSSTSDLLKSFINEKIKYHKVNRLMLTEANHNDDTSYDNSRINELKKDLLELEETIQFARANKKKFKLKSMIKIELID